MKRIAPLIIMIALAALMATGCTLTESSSKQTGSGWSGHVEFKF